MRKHILTFAVLTLLTTTLFSQTWEPVAPFVSPRNGHTLTALPDGRVLQIGGHTGALSVGQTTDTVEIYTPSSNSWELVESYPMAIMEHVALLTSNNTVTVFGGNDGTNSTNHVYQYDIANNSWSSKADMPTDIALAAAELLDDGKVFITAGWSLPSYTPNTLAFIYDPTTDQFTTVESAPGECTNAAHAKVGQSIILVGGFSNWSSSAKTYIFDLENETWSTGDDLTYSISGGAMSTSGEDGSFTVIGGFDFESFEYSSNIASYDLSLNTWTTIGNLPEGTSNGLIATLPSGTILQAGGVNNSKNIAREYKLSTALLNGMLNDSKGSLTAAYYIDATTGSYESAPELTKAWSAAAYTTLQNGDVIMTGGTGSDLANSYDDGIRFTFPIELSTVTFTVTEIDGTTPIAEVEITFAEETIMTDATGIAQFSEVEFGVEKQYTTHKENYATFEGVVDVATTEVAVAIMLESTESVNSIEQSGYTVFPNPCTTGNVTVKSTSKLLSYTLYNATGAEIATGSLEGEDAQIDVSNVKGGIYFLTLYAENNERSTQRLIIQ